MFKEIPLDEYEPFSTDTFIHFYDSRYSVFGDYILRLAVKFHSIDVNDKHYFSDVPCDF